MADVIEEMLGSIPSNGSVTLPNGEFEGQFIINKPCTISGNNTTLWAKNGTVLTILSPNVTIKNLRIELTEQDDDSCHSVVSASAGVTVEDVEVVGNVQGFNQQDNYWGIPINIKLDTFLPNSPNHFQLEIEVPDETEIQTTVRDVSFSPTKIPAGRHIITITTDSLKQGTYLFGDVIFKSKFNRRAYIFGNCDSNVTDYLDNRLIFTAPKVVKKPVENQWLSQILTVCISNTPLNRIVCHNKL